MKNEKFAQLYLFSVLSLNNHTVHCIVDEMHLGQLLGSPHRFRQDSILNSFSYIMPEGEQLSFHILIFYFSTLLSKNVGLEFNPF